MMINMTKASEKKALQNAKENLEKHKGKTVVTSWAGTVSWSNVGLGNGVRGVVVDWGLQGPRIEVLEDDYENAAVKTFYPGSEEGKRWRFT